MSWGLPHYRALEPRIGHGYLSWGFGFRSPAGFQDCTTLNTSTLGCVQYNETYQELRLVTGAGLRIVRYVGTNPHPADTGVTNVGVQIHLVNLWSQEVELTSC